MPRNFRIIGLLALGLLATRFLVVAVDAIAESLERRSLYR